MLSFDLSPSLQLRNLALADAPELYKLSEANRSRLREWLPWLDREMSEADTRKFIEFVEGQRHRKEGMAFGVFSDGTLAGVISYNSITWSNRQATIGYWIGASHSGKGLITRAIAFLTKYALEELNLHRVEIRCATGNTLSRRVPERLGFSHEGTLRDNEWLYDRFVDHAVYSLLKTDPAATRL